MAKKGRFILGAAVGAAVAGGLALLFAPKAGKELREDIAKSAKNLSGDLDLKIAKAKKDAQKLKGQAKKDRLATIEKAQQLKSLLDEKTLEFSSSKRKVTKVAAREADKLIQESKALLSEMGSHSEEVYDDVKKYSKKVSKSAGKIASSAKKEDTLKKQAGK